MADVGRWGETCIRFGGADLSFANAVRDFVKHRPRTISNAEDVKQVVRSSGSVGANYIESQEALSKKDFRHRVRIARKEAEETRYWLRLLNTGNEQTNEAEREKLIREATELLKILSAIINKT